MHVPMVRTVDYSRFAGRVRISKCASLSGRSTTIINVSVPNDGGEEIEIMSAKEGYTAGSVVEM